MQTTITLTNAELDTLRTMVKIESMTTISNGLMRVAKRANTVEHFLAGSIEGVLNVIRKLQMLERPLILAEGYNFEAENFTVTFHDVEYKLYQDLLLKGFYVHVLKAEAQLKHALEDNRSMELIVKNRPALLEKFSLKEEAEKADKAEADFLAEFVQPAPKGTLLN